MAKPKALLFVAPFGFGPAAKAQAILRSLQDLFDFVVVSRGSALEFLKKHRLQNMTYLSGLSSSLRHPSHLEQFDFAISINNVPAVHRLSALGFAKRTVLIDMLHDWRIEISHDFPPKNLLAVLAEDILPGFEDRSALEPHVTPVASILTLPENRTVSSGAPGYDVLVHLGGILSPNLDSQVAAETLESWIGQLLEKVAGQTNRVAALGKLQLSGDLNTPANVDCFDRADPAEVFDLISSSRAILTTPGIGFMEMAFIGQRPTVMLPPMNSTQLMHYRCMAAKGIPGVLNERVLDSMTNAARKLPWQQHARLLVDWLARNTDAVTEASLLSLAELSEERSQEVVTIQTELVNSLEKTDAMSVLRDLGKSILSGSMD